MGPFLGSSSLPCGGGLGLPWMGTSKPLVVPCSVILNVWEQYSFSADFTLSLLQIPFLNYSIRNPPASDLPACPGGPSEDTGQQRRAHAAQGCSKPRRSKPMIYQTVCTASAHPSPCHAQSQGGRAGRQRMALPSHWRLWGLSSCSAETSQVASQGWGLTPALQRYSSNRYDPADFSMLLPLQSI